MIDDEQEICDLVADVATALGMECTTATDPTSCQDLLAADFDLIIVDLVMPQMDGIELLRMLGERRTTARIVVMSGVGRRVIETAEALSSSLGLNIIGSLLKPFSIAQLESLLARAGEEVAKAKRKPAAGPSITVDEMRRGLALGELVLHYQPQIEIISGNCVGIEALVRWAHPSKGLLAPEHFVPLAERSGVIDALTWKVIDLAFADFPDIRDDRQSNLLLSINIPVFSLLDLSFPDDLVAKAERCGIPPEHLILEITESGVVADLPRSLDVLTRLRLKGIRLSIDDFGNGYSMLQQLRNIPANEIKIDRSLVENLHIDDARVMIRKVIELSAELDMVCVAEGVERAEQLDFLRRSGCDVAQGFLFAEALPKAEVIAWLAARSRANSERRAGR